MTRTTKNVRRIARNTSRGTNAVGIQRKINTDYVVLARDYGKLFTEIWRKPVTKYFLGGVALGVLAPLAFRAYGRDMEIRSFIRDNFDELKIRVEGFLPNRDEDTVLHS